MNTRSRQGEFLQKSRVVQSKPPALPKKTYSYSKIFEKVTIQRLKYYNKISFLVSLVLTALIVLPFKTNVFMFPFKVLMLWSGLLLIKQARDITLKVDSATYSTVLQQAVSEIFSSDMFSSLIAYLYSTFCVYFILYCQSGNSLNYYISSPTKTIKPLVNDKFVFFWFYSFFYGFVYTFQFLTLEKNKLPFKAGVYRSEPTEQLKSIKWISLFKESASISGFVTILAPFIYFVTRKFVISVLLSPFIYFFSLNHRMPKTSFPVFLYVGLFILSFLITLVFELANKIYNIYSMVGCLNVKKPLSLYSEDQVQTLISGLVDYKKPFARLTAYQELAYLSTASEVSNRGVFYSKLNWSLFLEQCNSVIATSSKAIKSDLPHLKQQQKPQSATLGAQLQNEINSKSEPASIFGNTKGTKSALGDEEIKRDNVADQTIYQKSIDASDLFFTPVARPVQRKPQPAKPALKASEILSIAVTQFNNFQKLEKVQNFKNQINLKIKENKNLSKVLDISSQLIERTFSRSIIREANKRLPNKLNLSHSIITISEILLHAKNEDKKNLIITTLGEVLTSLTRIYIATSEFINNPPVPITTPEDEKDLQETCIKEVNQLALDYFFKLVILYNSDVNELVLSPEVFKLAKWCIDLALQEQRNQQWDEDFEF